MASISAAVQCWNWMRGSDYNELPKKRIEGSRVRLGPFSLPLYYEFLEGGKLNPQGIGRPLKVKFDDEDEDSEDEDERSRPVPQEYLEYVIGKTLLSHLCMFPELYRACERKVRKAFKIIYHQKWSRPEPSPLGKDGDQIDGPLFTPYKLLDDLFVHFIFDPSRASYERFQREKRLLRRQRREQIGDGK